MKRSLVRCPRTHLRRRQRPRHKSPILSPPPRSSFPRKKTVRLCLSTSWTRSANVEVTVIHGRSQLLRSTVGITPHGRCRSQDLRHGPLLAQGDRLHWEVRRHDPGDGLVPRQQRSEHRHGAPQFRSACRARRQHHGETSEATRSRDCQALPQQQGAVADFRRADHRTGPGPRCLRSVGNPQFHPRRADRRHGSMGLRPGPGLQCRHE